VDGPWRMAQAEGSARLSARPSAGRPTATPTSGWSGRPPSNRRSKRATGGRMAVHHAVQWPSTRCRPLGLPTGRPLMPSTGDRPTRTFVWTLGRLDASGRRPSDVIFPKDVRCDNPAQLYFSHKEHKVIVHSVVADTIFF
jgi:hypothetical protein